MTTDQQPQATLTVGLAGLTSKLFRLVARLLLARHSHVQIRGLARARARVPVDIAGHPRVAAIVEGTALDANAVADFAAGCDVVLCAYLGPRDADGSEAALGEGQRLLADACERAGVKRFFPSDWTLDYTRLDLGDLPVKDPAIRTKRYLYERRAQGTRLRSVHVLNMGLTETILSKYFQVWRGEETRLQVWSDLDADVWEIRTYKTAAEYTVELILDERAEGVFKFLGDETTARGMAAAVEDVYAIKPEVTLLGSLEELHQKMHATLREGDSSWVAMACQYTIMSGKAALGPMENMDNKRYPNVKPESLRDFLRRTPLGEINDAYQEAGNYWWRDDPSSGSISFEKM